MLFPLVQPKRPPPKFEIGKEEWYADRTSKRWQKYINQDGGEPEHMEECLEYHREGDWGMVRERRKIANERALAKGGRIVSEWFINPWLKMKIVTAADRKTTKIFVVRTKL